MQKYPDIEKVLRSLRDADQRNAAEYAFVLAILYKQAGDNEQAIYFGKEAIALLKECGMKFESLLECYAYNGIIEGVMLPDLIYPDVIRRCLLPLEL